MQKGGKMGSVNLTVPIKVELPEDWIEQVINRLRNDPDSEWIEVVRCKDCLHYGWTENRIPSEREWWCYELNDAREETDFCSHAERREDG